MTHFITCCSVPMKTSFILETCKKTINNNKSLTSPYMDTITVLFNLKYMLSNKEYWTTSLKEIDEY